MPYKKGICITKPTRPSHNSSYQQETNYTNTRDNQDVGRVGGQSFLYFGLHSDYVGERNLVKGTIKIFFYKLF